MMSHNNAASSQSYGGHCSRHLDPCEINDGGETESDQGPKLLKIGVRGVKWKVILM